MDTSSRAGRVVSVSSLYWRSALESRRNSPRELGHGSPAGAQLLARHWEMQGADTALPAGDRDLINSVISRPDYLKGTGSGAFSDRANRHIGSPFASISLGGQNALSIS